MDSETGLTDLPANTPGELYIRAPNVCKGYYNNPKATKETFTHDGWLKTGDIAYYSSIGKFYIVDRKKASLIILKQHAFKHKLMDYRS